MNYLFRRAKLNDAEAIARLLISSWKYAYKKIMPAEFLADLSVNDWTKGWKSHLNKPENEVYVLLVDQEIIGVVEICSFKKEYSQYTRYRDYIEIPVFYLLSNKIGMGYGRKMMAEVLAVIRDRDTKGIAIWVLEQNKPAISFYEISGFSFTGKMKTFLQGNLKELLYIREIN